MDEYVPRRLRRFYRKGEEAPKKANESEEYAQNSGQPSAWGEDSKDYSFGESGKEDLERIPSMDYEDLKINERNMKDLADCERKSVEASMAQNEIDKFKKQNKRMPTKQETENIADNLYTQLKDNPVDYGAEVTGTSRREMRRMRGRNRGQEENTPGIPSLEIPQQRAPQPKQKPATEEIKSMIEEEPKKKSISSDEFDLGLGEEDSEDFSLDNEGEGAESIDDLSEMNLNMGEEICPNCKKSAEKVIYCPKCGTAYCKSCAKSIENNQAICPKCGAKTKI